jgi:hypothetical protein
MGVEQGLTERWKRELHRCRGRSWQETRWCHGEPRRQKRGRRPAGDRTALEAGVVRVQTLSLA